MRKRNIDEQFVKKFNEVRLQNAGSKFNLTALKDIFKQELDVYLSGTWLLYLVKHQVLIPEKLGKRSLYSFSKSPIHKEKLKIIYKEICSYNKEHCKKQKEEPVVAEILLPTNPIEDAIALLKSHGYRIYRQIIRFEEV